MNYCCYGNITVVTVSAAVMKIVLSSGTVFGNSLVIIAVSINENLQTTTNYFIVSLACADLLMGLVVMPFGMFNELGKQMWIFGQVWCDLWHAFDVLSSTASILNLSMIAVERYQATTSPIIAGGHITTKKCLTMIFFVWICSSCISFPAILWWRLTDNGSSGKGSCEFTTDPVYLLVSSAVSFYTPLLLMLVIYWKIYRIAKEMLRCLQTGEKIVPNDNDTNNDCKQPIRLRIHKGGFRAVKGTSTTGGRSRNSSTFMLGQRKKLMGISQPLSCVVDICSGPVTSSASMASKLRKFTIGKKLNKFNSEQKAAKTLAFVMGTFILCWLPFFICNVLLAIDTKDYMFHSDSVGSKMLPLVTWLGYVNSCVNPIIYAHSMRNFRSAFYKLLCPILYKRQIHRTTAGAVKPHRMLT